jgi:hypothetical protein
MERKDEILDLAELGTASTDTRGDDGVIFEGRLFWTPSGISDE